MSYAQHAIFALAVLLFFIVAFAVPAAIGFWLLPEEDVLTMMEKALAHPPESTSDMSPLCDQGIAHGPTLAHAVRPVCAVANARQPRALGVAR